MADHSNPTAPTSVSRSEAFTQRTLPLSALRTEPGFNPRAEIDRDAEFAALVSTMRNRGPLTPIRVRPADENGEHTIISGHRRFAAAIEAALTELPAIIDARAGTSVDRALLLIDAVIENDVRLGLNPLDRARTFRELTELGQTIKGVAENIGRSQRYVRTVLQVLELPDELAEHVGTGRVPQKAVPALAGLAKIHPGLATGAAAKILTGEGNPDAETWDDLLADPIWVAHTDPLPNGVYDHAEPVALANVELTDKARRDLGAITKYRGVEPTHIPLRSDEALEQAHALGALHTAANGWTKLIVGEDVVTQIVHDVIAADATLCRRQRRENAQAARDREAAAPAANGEPADTATDGSAADRERIAQERAAAEREEARQQRAAAVAFNEQLGAAVVNTLSRVKLDERVLKILTAIGVAGDLDSIAARGARYGFPGWVLSSETKTGKPKTGYLEKREAGEKARKYLAGATKPGEIAGRTLALLVMASLADENAVAQSGRTFYAVRASGMPWADEVEVLLDELAGEQLPDALVKDRLTARAEQRARAAQEQQARDAARGRVKAQQNRLSELTDAELDTYEADLQTAHGPYGAWQLESAIRRERQRRAGQTEPARDASGVGEESSTGTEA